MNVAMTQTKPSIAAKTPKAVSAVPSSKKKPAIFSFFAGAGFLDLGFEESGFDVVFVNEIYQPFLSAYRYARHGLGISEPEFGYDEGDIKKLLGGNSAKELEEKVKGARRSHGLVGFIGGPPCPDFSVAGKNRGKDGENGMLSRVYVNLIIKQQPDFFLFENVRGLWRTRVHREFYEQLKKKLRSAGYVLTERLINSIEYGAPQDRERIILVGFLKKTFKNGLSNVIDGTFPWLKYARFDKKDVFLKNWSDTDRFVENSNLKMPAGIIEELTVEHWFRKNDVDTHPNAKDHFQPRAALARFKAMPEGDDSKKSFKRLHRWRYSPTAAYGNNEVHLHPYKARRLTVAETLAIQSLPKGFVLPPDMTLSAKFKAVGNGVPFLAAKSIASSIGDFMKTIQ
jgi:DNA (cytosine-5)-methyltransferase 1